MRDSSMAGDNELGPNWRYTLSDTDWSPDPELQRLLESAWTERHDTGTGFRYRVNIERERIAPGRFGFLLQLNRMRLSDRRQPQQFTQHAPFDASKFNFNRVAPGEILLELLVTADADSGASVPVTLLINNSPLSVFHSLVVPERAQQRAQHLTPSAVRVALQLLYRLPDRRYRLAYNSPGALASVNHLHLHLVRIEHELYVQRAPLVPLDKSQLLYRLADGLPAQGFCYVLRKPNRDAAIFFRALNELLASLARRQMAYNLFFTWTHLSPEEADDDACIRVLVYPRVQPCANKRACSFNAAALELSGYVSVGDPVDYERLTEDSIRGALRDAQGDVYGPLLYNPCCF
ncbi:GDP-D-glucose phosphorylase 1 [Anopheles cruzii]|uniref:GDP-D-glucose phosphorylase 1 n=1 Tax=Anopheles cruzii TaxID=68878 RepID=UPI0022EC6003|nr:GDP-D-glucose phosphorylase 1 [Anopheles cruzii]XP_052867324.1 GDP-D-glucose phosphorylase 1 [Anopheles cruzii]XP_052867331.1 GDP-D-glucose phosphorylase 1 [Anopheles cruzii]XP_052867339.1 GDP-D-glucose phosphorylase 1 [Anopheles cruzii]XP_052867348.1 GDP-D-glucose phosphorylase 1 [Anopheles cruzii]